MNRPRRAPPVAAARILRSEEGTVTLWSLGLCIMLLFVGGLSLDLWRVFSERRALAGIVDASAIAGASGIDEEHFRLTGEIRLEPQRAEELALANLAAQGDDRSLAGAAVSATTQEVTVQAEGSVQFTLLKVLMPDGEPFTIEVAATATPRGSPG
ncbi:MAG: pilus assembly protein TadG-related protein [Actinomycetota bacterium]